MVRVCTVNSFFSRRTKSEKTKNGRFSFSVCCTKIDTRFSVPFITFLSNAKNEKRTVYRIFDVYRQYRNRNTACEKRIFVNTVFRVSHLARNEKNEKRTVYVPLVRFCHKCVVFIVFNKLNVVS